MKCQMAHRAAGRLFLRSQNRMHVQKARMAFSLLGRIKT